MWINKRKRAGCSFSSFKSFKIKNFKLLIAGNGIEKIKLKRLSEKLNISSKIKYFGFLKDVKPVLKPSNLYINSSYFEGFPNSVVEAINYGIPVICSQSHGRINEILLHGKCGTIFNNGSSFDLASKIEE